MLKHTHYSEGKDAFQDRTFSLAEWSAPTMVSPEEIVARLDGLALCGRRIKSIRLIGMDYLHTQDWIEEAVYSQLEGLPEEERQARSELDAIDPESVFFRAASVDDPLLIKFEDGDIFEILVPQVPEFCMSMNCIPWSIAPGVNLPQINADILFAPCLGQQVVAVETELERIDQDPMFFSPFPEPPYEREILRSVTLRLENGIGLRIGGWLDFCEIDCVDGQGNALEMPFRELCRALTEQQE